MVFLCGSSIKIRRFECIKIIRKISSISLIRYIYIPSHNRNPLVPTKMNRPALPFVLLVFRKKFFWLLVDESFAIFWSLFMWFEKHDQGFECIKSNFQYYIHHFISKFSFLLIPLLTFLCIWASVYHQLNNF